MSCWVRGVVGRASASEKRQNSFDSHGQDFALAFTVETLNPDPR